MSTSFLPSFRLFAPNQVIFAWGARREVGSAVMSLGCKCALVVADPAMVQQPAFAELLGSLAAADIQHQVFTSVQAEPAVQDCDAAIGHLRASTFLPDVVVAVGGGSALDVGKAIAAVLPRGGTLANMLASNEPLHAALPIVAVPTTAGSGSEMTAGAVFRSVDGMKAALASNVIRPRLVVVDPELTVSCPPHVTAESGVDALTHALESFCAKDCVASGLTAGYASGSSSVTRTLATRAVRLIAGHLETCVSSGSDASARSAVAEGSMIAALAYGNTGLHAVHALGYALAARHHMAHSRALAVFLPAVLAYLETESRVDLTELAEAFPSNGDDAGRLSRRVNAFLTRIGFSTSLEAAQVPQGQDHSIVSDALSISRLSGMFPGDSATAFPAIVSLARRGLTA